MKKCFILLGLSLILTSCGSVEKKVDLVDSSDRIISISYSKGDNLYNFELNRDTGTLLYETVHNSNEANGVILIDDDKLLEKLCKIYDYGVLSSDLASTYCKVLENLCVNNLNDKILGGKDSDKGDTNKDGSLTVKEYINYNINQMTKGLKSSGGRSLED